MLKTFCRWLAPGLLSAIPLLAAAMGNPQPGLGVGLAAGADGQLYAALVRDGHVQILRSNDLGQHWQAHSQVNSQAEAIAADAENAPQLSVSAQGALYVSWSRRFAERFTGDIRFARAENGRDFSTPRTVHRDQRLTGHSFVRQHLDRNGRLWLVWIDGRERLDNPAYQGSALYASHSDDGGRQFVAEYKLVDHSCQCCRLALAERADGSLLLFWRQLFEQGQRDHALLPLGRERPGELRRATFDGWQVDACPHHGPALAEDSQGRLHALWFSPHGEQGPLFYGQLADGQVLGQRGIVVSYSKIKASVAEILKAAPTEQALHFAGLNDAQNGMAYDVTLHRVSFDVISELPLNGEEYVSYNVTFELLQDYTRLGEGLSQYYTIRQQEAA